MKYTAILLVVALAALCCGTTALPTKDECEKMKAQRLLSCKTVTPTRPICVDYRPERTSTSPPRTGTKKTWSPERILGKVAGVACKETVPATPYGNFKESVQTDNVQCWAGRNGGMKTARAFITVSCCPDKSPEEKRCWKESKAGQP